MAKVMVLESFEKMLERLSSGQFANIKQALLQVTCTGHAAADLVEAIDLVQALSRLDPEDRAAALVALRTSREARERKHFEQLAKKATHRCKTCGALWRVFKDGSASLCSRECGKCCDNEPLTEQVEALDTAVAPPITQTT